MKKTLMCIFLLAVAAPWLPADTVVEEIIARVNDRIITRSELQRGREQLQQELQQVPQDQPVGEQERQQREADLLRDLIDQQLLLDRGAELGLTADTEVIKRLDEMRRQMNLESMEDLQRAAEQQGVDWEDYKAGLRDNIITQMVISREVGGRMQISQDDVRKYYEENKDKLQQEEQVRLSEILVATPAEKEGEQPDPDAVEAARKQAEELLAQIRKGASFEEVARKESQGPTAAQGGDIGYFKRGSLAKQLEDLTFGMKQGEVSDVIQTRQGFIILQVTEHQQAGVPPLKEVEDRIQNAIYYERLRPALRAFLTKLREDAYIDIKEGYVDTGASPNQTKPVVVQATDREQAPENKGSRKFYCLWLCKS